MSESPTLSSTYTAAALSLNFRDPLLDAVRNDPSNPNNSILRQSIALTIESNAAFEQISQQLHQTERALQQLQDRIGRPEHAERSPMYAPDAPRPGASRTDDDAKKQLDKLQEELQRLMEQRQKLNDQKQQLEQERKPIQERIKQLQQGMQDNLQARDIAVVGIMARVLTTPAKPEGPIAAEKQIAQAQGLVKLIPQGALQKLEEAWKNGEEAYAKAKAELAEDKGLQERVKQNLEKDGLLPANQADSKAKVEQVTRELVDVVAGSGIKQTQFAGKLQTANTALQANTTALQTVNGKATQINEKITQVDAQITQGNGDMALRSYATPTPSPGQSQQTKSEQDQTSSSHSGQRPSSTPTPMR